VLHGADDLLLRDQLLQPLSNGISVQQFSLHVMCPFSGVAVSQFWKQIAE
jgi:hypothetical protein